MTEDPVFEKAELAVGLMREVFSEAGHVAVCYSGGKDSTLLVHLALQALQTMKTSLPRLSILLVDTEVEIPRVIQQATGFLHKVREWAARQNLPVDTEVLRPAPHESFWALLVGKGYPAPSPFFRWCVKRLKVMPVRRYLGNLQHEVTVLLGSRLEESEARRRAINGRTIGGRWVTFEGVPNARAYLPIVDWTTGEVWEFLLKSGPPWGGHYGELFGLYWDALDECMFRPNSAGYTCNGRRFGCWTCTVVRRDRTLETLAASGGDGELPLLLEFKNYLRGVSQDPSKRAGVTRRGTSGRGPLTLSARRQIFEALKTLEARLGRSLLTAEHEASIRQAWEQDAGSGLPGGKDGHRGS